MEIVPRMVDHVRVEFPVYTREEAEGLGLDAVPWRDAQVGQWGITDDDYVMECKFRREYISWNEWPDTYHRFTGGRAWGSRKKPFNFEEIHANGGYATASGKRYDGEYNLTRTITKTLVHQAALQRVSKGIYDYKQLAGVFRHGNDPYYAFLRVKRFLLSKRGKQLVREQIEKIMIGGGMSVADWIDLGKRAFEKADGKNDVAEMRRIWEKWGEFLAIKEAHTREFSPIEGQKVLDAVSEDLKQLPGAKNGK